MNDDIFSWWGTNLLYCEGEYNNARKNERAVEVPIASLWVDMQRVISHDGLEVGNVLSHYRDVSWPVVDRYEEGAINIDVFAWDRPVSWIVSVSTLEHVRWDETPHEAGGSELALWHLYGLLLGGGRMLVTVPLGWNGPLDKSILSGAIAERVMRACTFVRHGDGWRQAGASEWRPYGRTTRWADAVWIGEFVAS